MSPKSQKNNQAKEGSGVNMGVRNDNICNNVYEELLRSSGRLLDFSIQDRSENIFKLKSCELTTIITQHLKILGCDFSIIMSIDEVNCSVHSEVTGYFDTLFTKLNRAIETNQDKAIFLGKIDNLIDDFLSKKLLKRLKITNLPSSRAWCSSVCFYSEHSFFLVSNLLVLLNIYLFLSDVSEAFDKMHNKQNEEDIKINENSFNIMNSVKIFLMFSSLVLSIVSNKLFICFIKCICKRFCIGSESNEYSLVVNSLQKFSLDFKKEYKKFINDMQTKYEARIEDNKQSIDGSDNNDDKESLLEDNNNIKESLNEFSALIGKLGALEICSRFDLHNKEKIDSLTISRNMGNK